MATESFTRTIIIDSKIAINSIANAYKTVQNLPEERVITPKKHDAPKSIIDQILNNY